MTKPQGKDGETLSVTVENVLMSPQGPVVILAPKNGTPSEKVLPIFIDQSQALNIQLALQGGDPPPRPMTHDLFSAVMNELGAIVSRVVIEELAQNTFYASLFINVERNSKTTTHRFDARPSDCIALAVRQNAPIEVRQQVMDSAAIKRTNLVAEKVEVDESDADPEDLGVSR